MSKIYQVSLTIIVLIFLFMESSELKKFSDSQDTVYFSNLNNTISLEKSLNLQNKNYLINELSDSNIIQEISMKLQDNLEIQKFKPKTKRPSGKDSIFVNAL